MSLQLSKCHIVQWRSQNDENVTHIKGRLLDQAVILLISSLFLKGTSLKGKRERIPSFKSSSFLYGKSRLPHQVTSLKCNYFITHVCNGNYANGPLRIELNFLLAWPLSMLHCRQKLCSYTAQPTLINNYE